MARRKSKSGKIVCGKGTHRVRKGRRIVCARKRRRRSKK